MNQSLILSVDDNEDDNFLLRRAFSKCTIESCHLKILKDGQEAIDYLRGTENSEVIPQLVLLDLKMPRKDGFAVLEWIRGQPFLKDLNVVVLTSSQSDRDVSRAYSQGAEAYLVKPVALADLRQIFKALMEWLDGASGRALTSLAYFRPPPSASNSKHYG